jgi:serine/threonine-protein kinase RsbW
MLAFAPPVTPFATLSLTFLRDTQTLTGRDSILGDVKIKRETMTLDSDFESVHTVEQTAEAYSREAGFDEDTTLDISMVAREAAVNAVLHGNKKDPAKHVTVSFELTGADLKITVADEGAGLDPDAIPDPLAQENLLRPSGRGVFLMRAYMDEVHFRQLTPGTEITLVKHRG